MRTGHFVLIKAFLAPIKCPTLLCERSNRIQEKKIIGKFAKMIKKEKVEDMVFLIIPVKGSQSDNHNDMNLGNFRKLLNFNF